MTEINWLLLALSNLKEAVTILKEIEENSEFRVTISEAKKFENLNHKLFSVANDLSKIEPT